MKSRKAERTFPPVLKVSGLSVRQGVDILRDVSWAVKRGEHWAVLGANGSGKTTLLNTLAGYMWPSEGSIEVLGQRYGAVDWRELRKSLGLVSSGVAQRVDAEETVLGLVASGKDAVINHWGKVRPPERKKALRILRDVECADLAGRTWQYLSQGERQRLLIGRALMADYRLLILDEPCAGLDPAAREHFLSFVSRLARRKGSPTMIFVTHHVEEIMPPFTHILVLRSGRVMAAGRKEDVLNSAVLSRAFGCRMRLSAHQGRYRLDAVSPSTRVV